MACTRKKGKARLDYSRAHIMQLVIGIDFFHDAFGDDVEAMRTAWLDPAVRQRVMDMAAVERRPHRPAEPWAHFVFDLGLPGFPDDSDDDALEEMENQEETT